MRRRKRVDRRSKLEREKERREREKKMWFPDMLSSCSQPARKQSPTMAASS